ncbi:MAG: hypothetical protein QXL85_01045 [Candidatus Bathyarchaeia archaeon]
MVHVSIQHIIGTVALIGLAVSVALAYQIVIGYVEENAIRAQLGQAAEYVSMNIANIVSLADFTYGMFSPQKTVSKRLNLPAAIGRKPYKLAIVGRGGEYYVRVEVAGREDLYAESPILVSPTWRIRVFTAGGDEPSDTRINPQERVYGGNPNVVVWCEKMGDGTIYIGLGLLVEAD